MPSLIHRSDTLDLAAAAAAEVPLPAPGGLWRDAARRLLRNRAGMAGLLIIGVVSCLAILAPWISPYNPYAGSLSLSALPPNATHLMGTDFQGRDELSRVLLGLRLSLFIGVGSVGTAVIVGGLVGALAGGVGGRVDGIVMRIVDVELAIPGILLAIGIVAYLGQGVLQIMAAVAIAQAPVFARLLRGSLLAVQKADYVLAARSIGAPMLRLVVRHMLPNALTPTIVTATLALGTAIIDVSGLGFLGLGPSDPRTAELGTMLQDTTQYLGSASYLVFFPSALIVLIVIGFNLLGDGLREALDPRLRR